MWTWLRSFANSDPGQDRQAEPTRTGGGADPPGSTPGSDVIAIAGFIDLDVKGLCLLKPASRQISHPATAIIR